jgi:hypothetical protein
MADVDTAPRSERRSVPPQPDWSDQAADTVVRAVGTVRDKTTGPALVVVRGVVYGTFAAIVGVASFVVLTIGAIRALDSYLPDAVFGEEHTWAAHLIVGLLFVIAGGVLFARRGKGVEQSTASER